MNMAIYKKSNCKGKLYNSLDDQVRHLFLCVPKTMLKITIFQGNAQSTRKELENTKS